MNATGLEYRLFSRRRGGTKKKTQSTRETGGDHFNGRGLGVFFEAFDPAEPPVGFDFEVLPADFFAGVFSAVVSPDLRPAPVSRRCRRAASTRLPTPRPSRASWVGVEVEPEIFFSGGSGEVSGFLVSASDPVVDLVVSVLLASPVVVESESFVAEVAPDSASAPRDPDDPPTRMAAPIPIRRRSFRFRHSGQVFSCFAVIDWKSSKACPHASQT